MRSQDMVIGRMYAMRRSENSKELIGVTLIGWDAPNEHAQAIVECIDGQRRHIVPCGCLYPDSKISSRRYDDEHDREEWAVLHGKGDE